jgi:hypothetical protein
LLGLAANADDQPFEHARAALDQIGMAVGDGIESARIDGDDGHGRFLAVCGDGANYRESEAARQPKRDSHSFPSRQSVSLFTSRARQ